MSTTALMDLLFPPARRRVLALRLPQPPSAFPLRELARLTESHAGWHWVGSMARGTASANSDMDVLVLGNVSDYEADPVSTAALQACIEQAAKPMAHAEQWLRTHRSDLLTSP